MFLQAAQTFLKQVDKVYMHLPEYPGNIHRLPA